MTTSERWKEKAVRRVRYGAAFLRFFWRRSSDDQGPLWAGMLTYASLLAVVPLMVVTFGVISAFPVFEQWSQSLRDFIFENFVPATGATIQQHLDRFVEKATELSSAGVLGLILSSLLLMVNMERALNRIWRAGSPRSPGSRFVVYWSVLTVGPLLLGASIVISSYVASLPFVEEAAMRLGVRALLLSAAPFAFSALAFTLIFMIVPNVSVPWRHAAGGALVAASLFEAAKKGFTLYVTNFPAYETIYGAFAAVPIFLIWVYLSWLMTLLGASFGAALGSFRLSSLRSPWPRERELLLLWRLLRHLWEAQKLGGGLSLQELLEREPRAGYDQAVRLLGLLETRGLAAVTEDGSRMLSRNLDDVRLAELVALLPLPVGGSGDEAEADSALAQALRELETHLDRPLSEYL